MKLVPISLACILFVSALSAQDVHTVFGTRAANTASDLQKTASANTYSWVVGGSKSEVKFNADGTGKSTFNFAWTAKTAQQMELALVGSAAKLTLTFSADYTSFTGTDFDGTREIHGSIISKAPPASTPPPQIAGTAPAVSATPAAAGSPSASGTFFNSLQTASTSGAPAPGVMEAAITQGEYTWNIDGWSGVVVSFKADGTGWSNLYKAIAWKTRGTREIEITVPSKKGIGRMLMRFNTDYSKYKGTDFGGNDMEGQKK